ncbi:hypothetical protein PAPYR_10402 [Paratrimastix pyriformis]|uniref:Uncharacterized protein n=1 Tax=Paratrimastix pyriformis TaxID=342808 RepID=A0ABQ8U5Z4_9EUKA|nr:hypothetical protein PAPYR_13475 [Paratrimastix pyriformis]KAJ4454795.1 hypothetical protein PAPYR_10402 [Paratrimastix pyriformis]
MLLFSGVRARCEGCCLVVVLELHEKSCFLLLFSFSTFFLLFFLHPRKTSRLESQTVPRAQTQRQKIYFFLSHFLFSFSFFTTFVQLY